MGAGQASRAVRVGAVALVIVDEDEIEIGSGGHRPPAELHRDVREDARRRGDVAFLDVSDRFAPLVHGGEKIDLHRPYVDDIFLVSPSGQPMYREPDLIDVWFDSGAVPYAAVLEGRIDLRGKRVGLILTGGNVDLDKLPWMAK